MSRIKTASKLILAIFMVGAGVMHFVNPDFYLKIMPPYVPLQQEFVYLSGVSVDPKVQREIDDFFTKHGVKSIAASDANMGCPHEEGEDFPVGEDCPFCPFWKGKQGSGAAE